jgi:phosphoribosylanthranilate isomerase
VSGAAVDAATAAGDVTVSPAPPRVKICCIASVAEALLAIRHGAAAIGLVSEMPSGPGVIPEALIAEIAAALPPGVASFLLTSRRSAAEIVEQQRRVRVSTIQLCDRLAEGALAELRSALPGVILVQVIHVTGDEALSEALAVAPLVDAILLDSGDRRLAVKQLGGTGRRHDWRISRRIRDAVAVPVYLAGGLRADNVAEAIATVQPFAVDVCSGVRTDGRLDEGKLAAFFAAVRGTAGGHPGGSRERCRDGVPLSGNMARRG